MPTIGICNSDKAFKQFCKGLFIYMTQFGECRYKYFAKYMQVFQKAVVNVPVDLYNHLFSLGLLDLNHHISSTYMPNKEILVKDPARVFVEVLVYHQDRLLNAYTVICTQLSSHWFCLEFNSPMRASRFFKY
ncbi:hypothetical protein EDD85DRAFT_789067 [Armillaria nabsnona]|nr:hypothetical protein EDD85DRAFT_789067 [Armillaria nabsnona]